jgi:hypothetical protein
MVDYSILYKYALELLHSVDITSKIRLIGISIKNSDTGTEKEIKEKEGDQLKIPFKEFGEYS